MTTEKVLTRRRTGILAASCAAVLSGPVAHAVDAGTDPSGSSPAASNRGSLEVEEVVVTARRRSEALIDVPAAVSAFTAADLESRGATQPADFLSITPGVYYRTNTTAGTSFINIRGVTQSRNAESPVAIVVDGVFLNNPLSFQNQLIDLQQIEVLKGPQGALYGRNASAGAIIITTKTPTNDFESFIDTSIGRHGTYQAEASVSGPIVPDKLLFRATGYSTGTDGFLKNTFLSTPGHPVYADGQKDVGGRLRLLWLITEDASADLRYSRTQTDGGFNNDIFDPVNSSDDSILDKYSYSPNVRGFNTRTTDDASVKVDWKNPLGTLTAVTGFNKLGEAAGGDSLPYSSSPADGTQWLINAYETYSQELRITSPDDQRFRWLAGGYYQHTHRFFGSSSGTDTGMGIVVIDRTGASTLPGTINPASGGITGTGIEQNADAVFGSLAYDITRDLELSGALRYDADREGATNLGPYGAGFAPNPFLGDKRALKFSKTQPKATLRYKTGNGNVYATYAQGFKTGGFNPQGSRAAALMVDPETPIQDSFGAETTTTYEVGYKGEFLDRRLTANLAGYYNEIKGANYFDFLVAAANQLNLNIGKVEAYGLEAEVVARLTDSISLAGSLSQIHNTIKEDQYDPNAVGKTSPYFPNLQGNLTFNWQQHLQKDVQGVFRADFQHVGRLYWDLEEKVRRPPLNFLDLRAGILYKDDLPLRVELFCKNCTNKRYINEALFLSELKLSVAFPAIDTRVYGIEVSKHF